MIDVWTISLSSAIVVVVTAVLFIGNTITYRDTEVGRIWAAGYLAGILTTLSFLTWYMAPEMWWTSASGNAAFAASSSLFWIGCRRQNGKSAPYAVAAFLVGAVLLAGLLPGPAGDEWAGAHVYFSVMLLVAALGAYECTRGELLRSLGSLPMAVVFIVEAVFFAGRLVFFTVAGPESDYFQPFFGSAATAFMTMIFVIVLSSSMSLIRSAHGSPGSPTARGRRGRHGSGDIEYNDDNVLTRTAFERVVRDWLGRAQFHDEQLALLHFDLDNLAEINTAFGREHANAVLARYTDVVRRFGPPHSDIGVAGPGRLVMATPMASSEAALAVAATVQAGLLEEPLEYFDGLRPTISIGVALTDFTGFNYERVNAAALLACKQASDAGGNRVRLDAGAVGHGPA